MPTRLARMGFVLTEDQTKDHFLLDLNKAGLETDKGPIDEHCECLVCKSYSRAYLHHLFRTRELLGYRLATFHNLFFLENLMREIRIAVEEGRLPEIKEKWLRQ